MSFPPAERKIIVELLFKSIGILLIWEYISIIFELFSAYEYIFSFVLSSSKSSIPFPSETYELFFKILSPNNTILSFLAKESSNTTSI